ncbi:MAG: hypothetical protein JST94_00955 [Bacteroidetes bacterium]|nr:hypothetical protein [Bacteroidota bacterium]MBS1670022.1 hypothetical protein [Bacteroidota bacterium]
MADVQNQADNNITIRFATSNDIEQIQNLNQKWLISNIDTADKTNGFLFGDPLKYSDLTNIIDAKELTVAYCNRRLVGYYLFDNYSDTEVLRQYSNYITDLIATGHLESNVRISKRASAVVEKDFQNLGLSKKLLELLLTEVQHKYDTLFSVVSKQNPKIIAHQKAGWTIIAENDTLYFVQHAL